RARALHRDESLARLEARPGSPSWVMETASMAHADNLMGLEIVLPDGSRGWLVYQELRLRQLPLGISRLALRAEHGEAVRVAEALLAHLYHQYPDLDTHTENIPADDPHLPAFFAMGYVESFRRIEMHRPGPRSLT
ncbi:MAG: hypothetical protein ACRDH2_09850, partial [Anaerolineales bacterium]